MAEVRMKRVNLRTKKGWGGDSSSRQSATNKTEKEAELHDHRTNMLSFCEKK
jgi:hypothetical protein